MKITPAASYSPTQDCAVPSALEGLTSEFGMGSGVAPAPWPPEIFCPVSIKPYSEPTCAVLGGLNGAPKVGFKP